MNEIASTNKIKTASKASVKSAVAAKPKAKPAAKAKPAIIPASPTPAAPAARITTIVAKVDVGFGNTLFLRGDGPDLSWDNGVEMTNTGTDEWTWTTSKATAAFLAKVLINDVIWSSDSDSIIEAGITTVITATF